MIEFIARAKTKNSEWVEAGTGKKIYPIEWVEGAFLKNPILDKDGVGYIFHHISYTYVDVETLCWKCPESEYWTNDILKVTIDDGDCLQKWIVPVIFSEGCFLVDIEYNDFMGIPIHHLELHGFTVEKLGNMIDNPGIFDPHKQ